MAGPTTSKRPQARPQYLIGSKNPGRPQYLTGSKNPGRPQYLTGSKTTGTPRRKTDEPRDYFTGPSTTPAKPAYKKRAKPAKPVKPSYKKRAKPIQMRPVKPRRMTK